MYYIMCGLFEPETGSFGVSLIGYNDGEKKDRALVGFNIYGKDNYIDIKLLFLNLIIR